MGTSIARYAAVALPGVNEAAKLRPDETNYYKVILGGFDLCNHSGIYYPLTPSVRALFEKGGIVRRRLDSGLCRGEYGHPKINGMALEEALQRLAQVDPLLTSHHIKSVELINEKDEYGKDIVLAIGMVKPTGPYGGYLQQQLDNPEENVAFSIRSFTNNSLYQGKPAKVVCDALTWDFVTEPGIKHATQFNTAGLEELTENLLFTSNDLDKAINAATVAGLENDYSTLRMVRTSLGWNKVQIVKPSAIDWGR